MGKYVEGESGFTLIEVLVAFAVASLFLIVLYGTFSNGLRASREAHDRQQAILLAESSLDLLIGTDDVSSHVDRVGRFKRELFVQPRPFLAAPPLPSSFPLYELTVLISWQEGSERESLTLSTLRMGAHP